MQKTEQEKSFLKKYIWYEVGIGIAVSAVILIYFSGIEFIPKGNDIYGHLYKARVLAEHIKQGDFYPLYTTEWYNGIQLFRYWPILTYYVMAAVYLLTQNIFLAYYTFLAIAFLISFWGWCLIANRQQKVIYIVIGMFYFFLPDNIRVTFGEGNLSRVFVFALLPVFMYFFTNFLESKKSFLATVILIALITSTHFMLAAMCAVIFCIYSFFSGLRNKRWYFGILVFVLGLSIAGILLLPGLAGGVTSDTSSAAIDTMKDWSQSLLLSISLTFRSPDSCCTFGLSALLIGIFIIVFGKRRCGTIIGLVFFILTSDFFVPFLIKLPLSQVWWMARFVQMCYVLIFYELGFVELKKQNRIGLVFVAIALDILPSGFYFTQKLEPIAPNSMLEEAADHTDNRLGVIDDSLFESYISYYVMEKGIDYVQGWAIQGARTKDNIIQYTEAMRFGYYRYSFKQMLELGCDTVLVKKEILPIDFEEETFLDDAAYFGYELVDSNETVYLFDHRTCKSEYGTNIAYDNLAIGSSALYISYMYPTYQPGYSECVDDYSYEQLRKYKKIYLSNFTYSNKEKLEDLLLQLSGAGVELFIDTSSLVKGTYGIAELLGVECQNIQLKDINDIQFEGVSYEIEIPYMWNTTYLTSSNQEIQIENCKLDEIEVGYLATYEHIHFIGFNLPYLQIEAPQENLAKLLEQIFGADEKDQNVKYEVIEIDVEKQQNGLSITTPKTVTSDIAFQDIFVSSQSMESNNHLLKIEEGTTNIHFVYPLLLPGMLLSLFGLIGTLVLYMLQFCRKSMEKM